MLKIRYPHPEGEHEAEALRRWNGQGSVRLFAHEAKHYALLMERSEPGDPLAGIGADEALKVFVDLLPRLWVNADRPFMSLCKESAGWAEQLPASSMPPLRLSMLSEEPMASRPCFIKISMGTTCYERRANLGS